MKSFNWDKGQPDPSFSCAVVIFGRTRSHWEAADCNKTFHFICFSTNEGKILILNLSLGRVTSHLLRFHSILIISVLQVSTKIIFLTLDHTLPPTNAVNLTHCDQARGKLD